VPEAAVDVDGDSCGYEEDIGRTSQPGHRLPSHAEA
jgi:hypothetical protein